MFEEEMVIEQTFGDFLFGNEEAEKRTLKIAGPFAHHIFLAILKAIKDGDEFHFPSNHEIYNAMRRIVVERPDAHDLSVRHQISTIMRVQNNLPIQTLVGVTRVFLRLIANNYPVYQNRERIRNSNQDFRTRNPLPQRKKTA